MTGEKQTHPSIESLLEFERRKARSAGVGEVSLCTLASGPRSATVAALLEILNRETGEFHHHTLRLRRYGTTNAVGWHKKPEGSVTLEGEGIEKLRGFLEVVSSDGLGEAGRALTPES